MNIKNWIDGMELAQLKEKLKEDLPEEEIIAMKQRVCRLSDMDRRKVFCPIINRGCIITCVCYVKARVAAVTNDIYPGYCSNFMLTGEV